MNPLRQSIQLHGLIPLPKHRLALKSRQFAESIEVVTGTAVVNPDDAGLGVFVGHQQDGIGVGDRQRSQNDGVYDGEESGVGSDTDGKREKYR
jgi:hypothetical protein